MPNQTLMSCDINNVTQSAELQDRLIFEVDSAHFTPDLCADLASRAASIMEQEANRHLFDVDFVPFSYIVAVTNPLKYQVRPAPVQPVALLLESASSPSTVALQVPDPLTQLELSLYTCAQMMAMPAVYLFPGLQSAVHLLVIVCDASVSHTCALRQKLHHR